MSAHCRSFACRITGSFVAVRVRRLSITIMAGCLCLACAVSVQRSGGQLPQRQSSDRGHCNIKGCTASGTGLFDLGFSVRCDAMRLLLEVM